MATRILYTSPSVEIRFQNDSYSIVALTDLDVGTLVLIEHVFSGNKIDMHALLFMDDDLRKALYPRYAEDDMLDSEKNHEKITMNAFQFGDDMVIGSGVCKFNHACKPNAYLTMVDNVENIKFYGAFIVARVKAGDEITLDYFNGHAEFHDSMMAQHGLSCSCTQESFAKSRARARIELNLASRFRKAQEDTINTYVDHHLAKHGHEIARFQKEIRRFAAKNIQVSPQNQTS